LPHPDTIRLLIKKPKKVGHRQWEKFYQEFFGLTVDLSAVRIPDVQADFSRLIISSSISSSWHSRIRRLLTANAMRSSFIGRIFAGGSASAASIESVRQLSTPLSTRAYNPNLSRLGIFLPV